MTGSWGRVEDFFKAGGKGIWVAACGFVGMEGDWWM